MWKLLNKLFGWNYIEFIFGNKPYITRIHTAQSGYMYVYNPYTGLALSLRDVEKQHQGFHLTRK